MAKKQDTIGFVLYEGPSYIGSGDIVVIATLSSSNEKTGNMVQVWILPKDDDPLTALQEGRNSMACGGCILQGIPVTKTRINRKTKAIITSKHMINRVCYVNVGRYPGVVYKAYKRGRYPHYRRDVDEVMLRGRKVRLGAYGDPAGMPISIIRYLVAISNGWTGYSHQMFEMGLDPAIANELAKYLMVSCHTPAQHAEAKRRGWRSFVAIAEGQEPPKDALECVFYTHGVQCIDCGLCDGLNKGAKDIYVIAHAAVGRNLAKVQADQGDAL